MKEKPMKSTLMPVPTAKHIREVPSEWEWTEPSVWTTRMLSALVKGVEGGKWYSLIDKVAKLSNLQTAFRKVKANKGGAGVDHVTIEMFERNLEQELANLATDLLQERYKPQAIKRVNIPKPGSSQTRPLGIPTVRDRVVQTALRNVIEPIFELGFSENSYGFRPGRGCKDALKQVSKHVPNTLKEDQVYVVDADLQSYFDTIPQEALMERVRDKISDGKVLALIESYLSQQVMESMRTWTPTQGTPQGAVISPLLANIYLNELDHLMAESGYEMVRYADDFVILCKSSEDAKEALRMVRAWTSESKLQLHPEKTHIADAYKDGFEFLGYRFQKGERRPRKKSLEKYKEAVRQKTKRNNGQSLQVIIQNLNRTLRGWYNYFKHIRWHIFKDLDSWNRQRLRSILRKRLGLSGPARGADHQRWKNKFFTEHGLFSLLEAYESERQSALR